MISPFRKNKTPMKNPEFTVYEFLIASQSSGINQLLKMNSLCGWNGVDTAQLASL